MLFRTTILMIESILKSHRYQPCHISHVRYAITETEFQNISNHCLSGIIKFRESVITCSKLTTETLEQSVKYVQSEQ